MIVYSRYGLNLAKGDFETAISTLEGFKQLLANRQGLPGELDLEAEEIDAIILKMKEAE